MIKWKKPLPSYQELSKYLCEDIGFDDERIAAFIINDIEYSEHKSPYIHMLFIDSLMCPGLNNIHRVHPEWFIFDDEKAINTTKNEVFITYTGLNYNHEKECKYLEPILKEFIKEMNFNELNNFQQKAFQNLLNRIIYFKDFIY